MQLRLTLAAAADSTKSQEVFMNIAILTDTNSGIFPAEGQAHGIHVLPMPVILDGKTYYEGVDLTAEAFYKHLEQGGQVSTSQPAPGDVLSLWEGLLADYDEVVYLPMSSGLSASCRSAIGLAEEFGGKVVRALPSAGFRPVVAGAERSGKRIPPSGPYRLRRGNPFRSGAGNQPHFE